MRDSCHKHKVNRRKAFIKHTERKDLPKTDLDEKFVGCSGKRRYPDLITAHAGAHHMCVLINSAEVYIYLCERCGGYHLTKAPVSPEGETNRWAYYFGKD